MSKGTHLSPLTIYRFKKMHGKSFFILIRKAMINEVIFITKFHKARFDFNLFLSLAGNTEECTIFKYFIQRSSMNKPRIFNREVNFQNV